MKKGAGMASNFLFGVFFGLVGFGWSHYIYHIELTAYQEEVTRQEAVIKEQHGKLCMLDGILRNEIKQFTLEWVDLSAPAGVVLRRRDQ